MPQPQGQRSFSAKSKPQHLHAPPRKQKRGPSVREYLRPDEVDAMVQAARNQGDIPVRDAAIILLMFRHGLRTAELMALRWPHVDLNAGYLDVHRAKRGHHAKHPLRARNCDSCGNSSAPTHIRRMCSCPNARRPCRHAQSGRLSRKQAKLAGLPFVPIPTSSAMRAAITWRLGAMIPGPFRIIWGIRTFSIQCATPPWRLTDSKVSGMIKRCRFSESSGAQPDAKPSRFLAAHCTDAPVRAMWPVLS